MAEALVDAGDDEAQEDPSDRLRSSLRARSRERRGSSLGDARRRGSAVVDSQTGLAACAPTLGEAAVHRGRDMLTQKSCWADSHHGYAAEPGCILGEEGMGLATCQGDHMGSRRLKPRCWRTRRSLRASTCCVRAGSGCRADRRVGFGDVVETSVDVTVPPLARG